MPTRTTTQYLRQNAKLEATPSVKTCVGKILSESVTSTTPGTSSSGQLEAAGASISGRPVATEDSSSGKNHHHLHTSRSSTILQENSSRRARRSTRFFFFTIKYWTVYVQDLKSSRFPAQRWDLEPIFERLLSWVSSRLIKDHQVFKRMAMKRSFREHKIYCHRNDKCKH